MNSSTPRYLMAKWVPNKVKCFIWRSGKATLRRKGLRIGSSKARYLYCDFGGVNHDEDIHSTIEGQVVLHVMKSKYLGSFFQSDEEIDSYVAHHIQVGWSRWRAAIGVLSDHIFPTNIKRFYTVTVRHAMLYGIDYQAIKKSHACKLEVAEMRILKWMCRHTWLE